MFINCVQKYYSSQESQLLNFIFFINFNYHWLLFELERKKETISILLSKKTTLQTLLKLNSSLLSKSESVKFSLIESVICLFTESSVETIFFTVKSVDYHCLISEKNIFHC